MILDLRVIPDRLDLLVTLGLLVIQDLRGILDLLVIQDL